MQENNPATNAKVGSKVKCCTLTDGLEFNGIYVVKDTRDDGYCLELEGIEGAWWHSSRFELIKEGDVQKKFNPKPGDKIICNNGEEFICCTLAELMQKYPAVVVKPHKTILSYREKDGHAMAWQSWFPNGNADYRFGEDDNTSYDIREVIPAESKEVVKEEETRYSTEEIESAFSRLGWFDGSLSSLLLELKKINDPQYKEYLRLKAIYE